MELNSEKTHIFNWLMKSNLHFYPLWPSSWHCMYNEASDQDYT